MINEEELDNTLDLILDYSYENDIKDMIGIVRNENLDFEEKQKQLSKKYWNTYTNNDFNNEDGKKL